MGPVQYRTLLAAARRVTRHSQEAEDLVQEALLEAVRAGRDLNELAYLCGIIRNKARMAARGLFRRQWRDTQWHGERSELTDAGGEWAGLALDTLPRALRVVAALALSGHDRREIGYLLDLSDTALRQRISMLGRHMRKHGVDLPVGLPGLRFNLAYGRIRDSLVPALHRHGGALASHDPDGHLIVVRRSQNGSSRQDMSVNSRRTP